MNLPKLRLQFGNRSRTCSEQLEESRDEFREALEEILKVCENTGIPSLDAIQEIEDIAAKAIND